MSVFILRFSASFGTGRLFCGDRYSDTGIVKCRIVIPPAVVILFRDFSVFQLGGLFLPGTKPLIQIGSVHTAIKDLSMVSISGTAIALGETSSASAS